METQLVTSNKPFPLNLRCPSCRLTFIYDKKPKDNICPICDKDILYNLNKEKHPRLYYERIQRKQQKRIGDY